jgi:hypothetical protein
MKGSAPVSKGNVVLPKAAGGILLLILLSASGLFFARKIDMPTADLGRHLMNGKIFLETRSPIRTNYYSYTQPGLPVVNHHWGSGVIFYLVFLGTGYTGLSLFNILVLTATLYLFYRMAVARSDIPTALFITMLALPMAASRAEVRPEIFSNLFAGILLLLMERYRERGITLKNGWVVPLLMVAWVNLHIFFLMGIFIQTVYMLDSLLRRDKVRFRGFAALLAFSALACLLNPSGIRGFIEPFLIFREYGYRIVENQSVFFIIERFQSNSLYYHFLLTIVLFAAVILFRMIRERKKLSADAPVIALLLVFAVFGTAMIRGIPLYGFFFIPVMSGSVSRLLERHTAPSARLVVRRTFLAAGIALILAALLSRNLYFSAVNPATGLGWDTREDAPVRFFSASGIKGPVFNNYDIGGYLIFHLFPSERVFVDNRPEAYTVPFFRDIYEPMQASEDKWREMDRRYRFNVIFFYRLDNTEFAQPFLIRRLRDPAWAPVFVDDRTLILLKNNTRNETVIRQYALPLSLFGVETTR